MRSLQIWLENCGLQLVKIGIGPKTFCRANFRIHPMIHTSEVKFRILRSSKTKKINLHRQAVHHQNIKMSTSKGPRQRSISTVYRTARLVTCESECRSLIGALWKSKIVSGTVIEARYTLKNGRKKTVIHNEWKIP